MPMLRRMEESELIKVAEEMVENIDMEELRREGFICKNGQFFPSVHYPPITMYPPNDEIGLFEKYDNPKENLFVIYVHFPFCIKHCIFCHYPVKLGDLCEEKEYYLSMLDKEIQLYIERLGVKKLKARSILFGGGTPTYLTPPQLEKMIASFLSKVELTSCTQFNYDVDPVTLLGENGYSRLRILRRFGVDRLTIGVQSFDNRILAEMNRPYFAKNAIKAIQYAKQLGFKVCIEFIYGYPTQTLRSWIETIENAILQEVDEIQLYRLKVIPYGDYKGSITQEFSAKPYDFVGFKQTMLMKAIAAIMLSQNGYNENLTRVFSRKPEDFSHYAVDQCCNLYDQIGFGLTAFSSLRDRFVLNTQDFNEYYALIKQGKLPINRGMIRRLDEQLRWAVILPLKNKKVYKDYYKKVTGFSLDKVFRSKIDKLKDFNLLCEDSKVLTLTSRGRFFADEVCQQFHHIDYMPLPPAEYSRGQLNPYDNYKLEVHM